MDQTNEQARQREQLLKRLHDTEKSIQDCPIQKFTELRYQLKQTKEKLRSLDNLNRTK